MSTGKAELILCECGCGAQTPPAKRTNKSAGHVKGKPIRFVPGHQGRMRTGKLNGQWRGGRRSQGGYITVKAPGHPRVNRGGYVFEHILICEKILGKFLPPGSEPHHFDGNKANNINSNLVICQDRAYHMLLEQRTRAFNACGHAKWRKCVFCKQYDDPINLTFSGKEKNRICHRKCEKEYRCDAHNKKRQGV